MSTVGIIANGDVISQGDGASSINHNNTNTIHTMQSKNAVVPYNTVPHTLKEVSSALPTKVQAAGGYISHNNDSDNINSKNFDSNVLVSLCAGRTPPTDAVIPSAWGMVKTPRGGELESQLLQDQEEEADEINIMGSQHGCTNKSGAQRHRSSTISTTMSGDDTHDGALTDEAREEQTTDHSGPTDTTVDTRPRRFSAPLAALHPSRTPRRLSAPPPRPVPPAAAAAPPATRRAAPRGYDVIEAELQRERGVWERLQAIVEEVYGIVDREAAAEEEEERKEG